MRTYAIVVNWNGGEMNLACLASLSDQGAALEGIVFVDNASTDGSLEAVRDAFPGIVVLAQDRNLGYGEGNNLGIAEALGRGAEAVFLANNDLTLEAGALARLVEALEGAPGVGIVGPRVLEGADPSTLWAAGGTITWRRNLSTLLGQGQRDGAHWRTTRDVDYVPGCALLMRREVIEGVGDFDVAFFAYSEDVDLCRRAQEAGFGVRCVGEVAAVHASSASTGGGYNPRRKYMMGVNSIWFLRKHGGFVQWSSFVCFDVLTLPFVWLANLPRGRGKAVLAKALGIGHGLLGRRVDPAKLEPGASRLW